MRFKFLVPLFLILICLSCISSYESQDREELIESFAANFGFMPPNSITEIKLKKRGAYDTEVQWMSFTCESEVLEKIIATDTLLEIINTNDNDIVEVIDIIERTHGKPDWFLSPDTSAQKVYFKKGFLKHTFSEYYLWVHHENGMAYLFMHYFD